MQERGGVVLENLYKKLISYSETNAYPFHMPGHKRNMERYSFVNPFSFDITEIDGFDNLHHAEGILMEAQRRASRLYGAEETYFLVNGSTVGLLSAISACTKKEGKILVARNSHKAVYHGVFLNNLECDYIYPQKEQIYGVNGGLLIDNIKEMLITCKKYSAILITSPSFDGIVSDVKGICKIAHKYGIPVIVDEAHGAHFGFHSYFPESAINSDADIVIHSVHKTLPSLTQTALLHVNGTLVDCDKLKKYLAIYQTSSPSYVLMASIDQCMDIIEKEGNILFDKYVERLSILRQKLATLEHIKLIGEEIIGTCAIKNFDRSKILLSVKNSNMTGKELYQTLLHRYDLQLEMAAGDYVLAMTSIMDTMEGFERLYEALKEIDHKLLFSYEEETEHTIIKSKIECKIAEAEEEKKIRIPLIDSEGKISGEYVYLYPPGIPLLVPGERISKELLENLFSYQRKELNLEGLTDYTGQTIQVLTE